jgi:cellulose synthase/poly-beta-1,6-N-acetylglucosamine synthase-like glycosyltransferase
MDVSVVVPARNAGATIGACLEGLLAQREAPARYEVIVVDDGSTDDTRVVAEVYDVTLITQPHEGPAAARNRGVAASRGDVVLFTDADCLPDETWVREMIRPFEDPKIVGVKGVYRTRQKGIIPRFVQCEYEERYELMSRHKWIDFVDTYSAGYRRDVFLGQGGFDVSYPNASVEDQEFSFRLAEQGWKMLFNPQAVVYHQHPETLAAYFGRKFNIGYWKVRVLRRHPTKAVQDSHTPQTLKTQMALAVVIVPLLALVFLRSFFWLPVLLTVLLYLISTVPFVFKTLRRDLSVGLVAPFLLLVRALALAMGMIKGAWDMIVRLGAAT